MRGVVFSDSCWVEPVAPSKPLVISWVPSVGVTVVAILITTINIPPIVIIVMTVVVVVAIVIVATIVVTSAIVVLTVVVILAVVVFLLVAVVISISFVGTGPLIVSQSRFSSCWRLPSLWLNLSDGCGIAVE